MFPRRLPAKNDPPQAIAMVDPIVPPGVTVPAAGAAVRVQVVIDLDGASRYPTYVSGPMNLAAAAIDAARKWSWRPARTNGAPTVTTTTVTIAFKP